MKKKYYYTSDMKEISGFGGDYELACRKMVVAGLEWLEKQEEVNPKFEEYKYVYGLIKEKNEDAEKLRDVMVRASGNEATGAMVQATVNHVLYIWKNGWDKYKKESIKLRKE